MKIYAIMAMALALVASGMAQADIAIDTVSVGDAGNAADTRYETPGYGSVSQEYRIGRLEVTNWQYMTFLNAVAGTDPSGLYNPEMAGPYGGIRRIETSGTYTYAPKSPLWNARPVNFVSFYDCLRFANWLHNGQPAGAQDASTTEDGAYDMSLGQAVARKPGAKVFLPSEDEWYKAAYYKGQGANAGYWTYATQSDTAPVPDVPPGDPEPPGSANYQLAVGGTTRTGAYTESPGPYGTFDQAGNVFEWNEADIDGTGTYRGLRGGSWQDEEVYLEAACRGSNFALAETHYFGFRIAEVPEPATLSVLALGALAFIRRRARW